MKKNLTISISPLLFLLALSPAHAETVKDLAKDFCQTNYDQGRAYYGQSNDKHSSWQSCVDHKLVDFSVAQDPNKKVYQPQKDDIEYAKAYCTRTTSGRGNNVAVYGGAAEPEQPNDASVNYNSFTSYDSCLDRKTKEHFYGKLEWKGQKPFKQTTPEERAREYCAKSIDKNCYQKKLKEINEREDYIKRRRAWNELYGDGFLPSKYYYCAKNNEDCGGIMPVREGDTTINTELLTEQVELGGNCGVLINYFNYSIKGENKSKLPDGRVLDFGDFENKITQDYLYTIITINESNDQKCPLEGKTWFPEEFPREENLRIALQR